MKIILSLAVAAATLLGTSLVTAPEAEARHQFCRDNPDSPRCFEAGDEDVERPVRPRREGERRDRRDEFFDDDEDVVVRPRRVERSCRGIARWLAFNNDFRAIEANDCEGRNFGYTAVRGRWVYLIKVDSRNLRIISSVRLRRSRR